MLLAEPLPFIKEYLRILNSAIEIHCPGKKLSQIQQYWLSFCVMAIIITNSICWSRFAKANMGRYSAAALSWMFRKSKISWDLLLQISVTVILKKYGITEGSLGVDDSDKKRSKLTKKIYRTHKVFDKSSGGYFNL